MRSNSYHLMTILNYIRLMFSNETMSAACWKLMINFGSTLIVVCVAYTFPAFVSGYRYLYDSQVFTWSVTGWTAVVVYLVQLHAYHLNLWRGIRSVSKQEGGLNQNKIIACLDKIEGPFLEYQKLWEYYRPDYFGALRADCIGEWMRYIIKILQSGLTDDNKVARGLSIEKVSFWKRVCDVLRLKERDTSVKVFLNVVFYTFAITGLVYLIDLKQWGSAGQTSYGLMSVGVLLYVKTIRSDIPLDAFMPFFMRHNNFNVVSLFAVLLPLKFKLVNFDGLPIWADHQNSHRSTKTPYVVLVDLCGHVRLQPVHCRSDPFLDRPLLRLGETAQGG